MNKKCRLFKDDEHDLLIGAVMLDADVTTSFIVSQSDCQVGERQINKYRDGSAAVPMWFWTLLYRLTRDHRITQLITGDANTMVIDLPEFDDNNPASIIHIIETAKTHANVISSLGEIFANGKVDRKDFAAVAQLEVAAPEAIKAIARANHAVQTVFKKTKY